MLQAVTLHLWTAFLGNLNTLKVPFLPKLGVLFSSKTRKGLKYYPFAREVPFWSKKSRKRYSFEKCYNYRTLRALFLLNIHICETVPLGDGGGRSEIVP